MGEGLRWVQMVVTIEKGKIMRGNYEKRRKKNQRVRERGVGTLGTFGLGDGKRENKMEEKKERKERSKG